MVTGWGGAEHREGSVYVCACVCSFIPEEPHQSPSIIKLLFQYTHTHTHTHTHTVRAEGPLVCVSVKFPWQQIIHSRGMESLCEIQVVCGGLLLLNSHCPFERQAESLSVSPLCSAPRNCETHSLPCYEARTHTHTETHTLCCKKHEEEFPKSVIEIKSNGRGTEHKQWLAWRSWLFQNLRTLQLSPDRIRSMMTDSASWQYHRDVYKTKTE